MTGCPGFWDAHACLPLHCGASLRELARHRSAGCRVVGVNAGFDGMDAQATLAALTAFAADLACTDEGLLDVGSILRGEENRPGLGVYFDIEGADVLDGDAGRLEALAGLGLRSLTPVYNRANRAGGGCHDPADTGLTAHGRRLIARQNELGIIVDASHCSRQTSLDMCALSTTPVVFSHSNCRALVDHPRNVSDDQIRAVAATGGLVAINGSSVFLGTDNWSAAIADHVQYAVELVGVAHVGVGLDYVYDLDDLAQLVAAAPALFPDGGGYEQVAFCPPEEWSAVEAELGSRGFAAADVEQIRWANFERVARETFTDV